LLTTNNTNNIENGLTAEKSREIGLRRSHNIPVM
jgi:hypothetical protein